MSGEIGYGATIGFGTTQGGSYTDVAEVTEITMPSIEVNDVDKTHYLSPDAFREFTPGLANSGELTFKILFDKTEQATLFALARTFKWWRIQFPLAETESTPSDWKSYGYLKGFQNMIPLDDKMEAEIKIKFSGTSYFVGGS